jgi:hypothetical protein
MGSLVAALIARLVGPQIKGEWHLLLAQACADVRCLVGLGDVGDPIGLASELVRASTERVNLTRQSVGCQWIWAIGEVKSQVGSRAAVARRSDQVPGSQMVAHAYLDTLILTVGKKRTASTANVREHIIAAAIVELQRRWQDHGNCSG